MKTEQPPVIRLSDYAPPRISVESVDLGFDLAPSGTQVAATLRIARTDGTSDPIFLEGEALRLLEIEIDGQALSEDSYKQSETGLTLLNAPDAFTLRTVVSIDPADNTRLEGLYQSNGIYCTQCEAEGFRRITFFPDRPDVMSRFRVTVRADRAACPVLLSNGNLIEKTELEDGRHSTVWEDPFPKPAYLFALVAGRLDALEDTFETMSGRKVDLKIWVEPGNAPRCAYAMDALKRSMKWDEDRFGLEYDLDIFNIVAVSDFNMGAMENKSLNVFNAKYILADSHTATDTDYANIEAIVGHEYFHNWTGNRVTCRDWFQLSLKEGLTVFRDQEFSADMRSRAVKRIQDVRTLRARQFPEDAGPLAHPVRPESYIEINNFYTATVYEKGAEVIRMMHAMLGEDGFQKGMKLYFDRHDGQAVTCDDFAAAMADANDVDLTHFKLWYSQSGTPEIAASWTHDPKTSRLALTLSQTTKATPGQAEKKPLQIPIRIGLIGPDGTEIGTESVVTLAEAMQKTVFEDVPAGTVPSINRGFSAPITLKADYSPAERVLLMGHDSDPFARWEAGQQYATALLLQMVADLRDGKDARIDREFIAALGRTLTDETLDPAFRALAIALPTEDYIAEQLRPVPVEEIHEARIALRRAIGDTLWDDLIRIHDAMAQTGAFDPSAEAAGQRALRNAALSYLVAAGDPESVALARTRYDEADNMTDRMAALSVLADTEGEAREGALADFYERFRHDEQVIDKWLSVQSMSARPDTLDRVRALMDHPVFSIRKPNKVRALVGAFAMGNPICFHAPDGSGYKFVVDFLQQLDKVNPQVAARMLGVFGQWRRLTAERSQTMKAELQRFADTEGLSRDCTEIATKSLSG